MLEELGDGDFGVFHEALLQKAGLCEELGDLTFEDIFDDILGFALLDETHAEDVFLGVDDFLRDIVTGKAFGCAGRDVKGEVLNKLLERRLRSNCGVAGADFKQHADFAAEVDVGSDHATGSGVETDVFTELEVFTEFDDLGFHEVFEGAFAMGNGECGCVVGGVGAGEFVSNAGNEGLEVFVFGNEVGLAVHFEQDAGGGIRVNACGDDAFVGFAVGFGTGFGDAAFAEEFDGSLDVAIGLGEDFLQSIMPALVLSRSSLTIDAVIMLVRKLGIRN